MHGVILSAEVDNPGLVAVTAAAARIAAKHVRGGLPRSKAARMCHAYIRGHTRYLEETDPDAQLPRMPWRFVADGVGDCKSQAIYTAAVCAASGCRVVLRFATLPGETEPGHVYAVVDNFVADPLLPFGEECPYIVALDIPIRTR
jgi:transglutaminase-like putative cysteine protease